MSKRSFVISSVLLVASPGTRRVFCSNFARRTNSSPIVARGLRVRNTATTDRGSKSYLLLGLVSGWQFSWRVA